MLQLLCVVLSTLRTQASTQRQSLEKIWESDGTVQQVLVIHGACLGHFQMSFMR